MSIVPIRAKNRRCHGRHRKRCLTTFGGHLCRHRGEPVCGDTGGRRGPGYGDDVFVQSARGPARGRLDPRMSDPALGAVLAEVEQHAGRFIGEGRVVQAAFVQGDVQTLGAILERRARDLSNAAGQRIVKRLPERLSALKGEIRLDPTALGGEGARRFVRRDFEARQIGQDSHAFRRHVRHLVFRDPCETRVGQRSQAPGQGFRVVKEMSPK